MSTLLFFAGYLCVLTLPGLALTLGLRLRFNPVVSTIALSYISFTLIFISANYFDLAHQVLLITLVTLLISSAAYLAVHRTRFLTELRGFLLPICTITLISLMYQLLVGAYTEVPADLYAHLDRFQIALGHVQQDSLGNSLKLKQLLMQKSGVYYYLLATIASQTQTTAVEIMNAVDFTNRTVFLIAVYFSSRFIFSENKNRALVAALTCVFVALHMGINVFAYIRYYSLAPGMLNFVIYLFGITAFLWVVRKQAFKDLLKVYPLILLATIAAAAIHLQEAMFIAAIISLIAITGLASRIKGLKIEITSSSWQVAVVSICVIVGFAILYSMAPELRAPNAHWQLWEFGEGPGIFPQISTLNLKKEFIQALTLWGVLVYLLFLLNISRYRQNHFVLAGMLLVPVFTFMNPLFVDLFLRQYSSRTLWRLAYLLPIHYVAADLIVFYGLRLKNAQIVKKAVAAVALFGLVSLLFTPSNLVQGVSYNRLSTLLPHTQGVDHRYYADLISFLNSIEGKHKVLTDPMTGYMTSALSPHYSARRKFFRSPNYAHFTFEHYDDNPLDKYSGYLLIVNQREKHTSAVGKASNHWMEKQWAGINHYYPTNLINHLNSRSNKFKVLWSENGVSVYLIQ